MTTLLIESLDLSEAQFDGANRVLRNVGLIRAGKSLNRRYYSEAVLQGAVKVFEGSKAFDSHAKGERRVGELTGWYENVRYDNGVLRADRHFLPTSAGKDVMAVVEAITTSGAPRNLAGLSINAVGTGKVGKIDGDDYLTVESITAANSVDDVVNPAAGGSYVESAANGDELMTAYLNALSFEEFFNARPEYIKRIQNEMKTVRQDDAIKAAKADADKHLSALTEAQNELTLSRATNEAALAELATARRDLAIEKALRAAGLPAIYENDLRKRLSSTPESEWLEVISTEKKKAKRTGATALPVVTGAGQQIAAPINVMTQRDPKAAMREALSRVTSPEDLLRIQESVRL